MNNSMKGTDWGSAGLTEGTKLVRKQLSGDVSEDKKGISPVVKRDVNKELENYRKYRRTKHEEKRVLTKQQVRDKKRSMKVPILPLALKSAKKRELDIKDKTGISPLI